jgi:hypothetical protein
VLPCPGRDAALFALLRRTGIVPNTGGRYGPGSAAHRKSAALRLGNSTLNAAAIAQVAVPAVIAAILLPSLTSPTSLV